MCWSASMLHNEGGAGGLTAASPDARSEDRARAFAAALTGLGIECRIDVHESVVFLVPTVVGAEAGFANPELRQSILATGRAHGFPRVALIVGDD